MEMTKDCGCSYCRSSYFRKKRKKEGKGESAGLVSNVLSNVHPRLKNLNPRHPLHTTPAAAARKDRATRRPWCPTLCDAWCPASRLQSPSPSSYQSRSRCQSSARRPTCRRATRAHRACRPATCPPLAPRRPPRVPVRPQLHQCTAQGRGSAHAWT